MSKRAESSTKFIGRNRAPRVHISYDLYVGDAMEKVELPFVLGVMSDLSGKMAEGKSLPAVKDREFKEVDMDNFDGFMGEIKPRVAFSVPNVLSEGGGNIAVDISFDKMQDFSPEAIARKVEPLRKLLDMRTELTNLLSFMDGKTQAEDLIQKLISDESLMKSVLASKKPAES